MTDQALTRLITERAEFAPAPAAPADVDLTAAMIDVTAAAADGDAAPPGNAGTIDINTGGKTLTAGKTLTLTATLTGTGAGTPAVNVPTTAGMTAAQLEAAIIAAWNGVAGLSAVTASAGTGTAVAITAAAGTQVTGVAKAVA